MVSVILVALLLLTSIPAGMLLAGLTRDEKPLYRLYLPIIGGISAIIASFLLRTDIVIGLALVYIFVMTLVWSRQ